MIVAVGGQCRNAGKTTLVCRILQGLPEIPFTAIKISRHSHREHVAGSAKNDTGRYLAAGARQVHLLRGPTTIETLAVLRPLMDARTPLLIESNSVLEALRPDCYFVVVDSSQEDVKDSVRRFLDRADGVYQWDAEKPIPAWCLNKHRLTVGGILEKIRERWLCQRKAELDSQGAI